MASANKQERWFPPYFCDACSRLSDSREDAKVRGTQKKGRSGGGGGGGTLKIPPDPPPTFSIPADPTFSEPGTGYAILSGSSHIGQVFVPLFGALAEQLFVLYRMALHICMSNSFVHFSNPRGFHSVFSDFPLSSNANNCPNSNLN